MSLERGSLAVRRDSKIPRPKTRSPTSFPDRNLGPIPFRLYCSKPIKSIRDTDQLIFMVPGGGFVSMPPICHDDYTSQWARLLPGVPIVSIDYGKAPENPFPWAIEEVFDAYRAIVESNGAVIGLTGWFEKDEQGNPVGPRREPLRISFVGDSAYGFLYSVHIRITV